MPVSVSTRHKALIVPDLPGTRSALPVAKQLPDSKMLVVPHGMRETLLLRHLGFKVPSPISLHYDYCGGKPFEVQKKTVAMLTEHPRAYVLNHMGTGKTKAALWSWDALNKEKLAKKLLVVAPLSTLKFVWAREIFNTLPGRKVEILHGSKEARLEALSHDADIYVINHDGLKVVRSELHSRADIDSLVLDELAVYRNNSERSKTMRKFARRFNIVWGLTGAPMPNEPTDVWGQCQIITPHSVPKSRTHCKEMLMERVSTFKWVPKPNAVQLAFNCLQPSVRFALDDVVELPDAIDRMVDVELSSQQKNIYRKVTNEMAAMIGENKITAVNAGVAMGKLLQVAGGWVYGADKVVSRLDATERLATLIDLINSADQKVIVYVPYRHMIEGIKGIFDRLKEVNFNSEVVHGDTKDRESIFHLFQNSNKFKVLLAHPGTVSHGLTLTAADTIIWYLPVLSLETYEQANARIRRVGQHHKQQFLHLCSTPVERRCYRALQTKQKLQNALLDLLEEATRSTRR